MRLAFVAFAGSGGFAGFGALGLWGFGAFAAKQKTPREYARGLRADVPGFVSRR
jgi:hypothetical protein